jgi:hypothetical protein
MPFLNGKNWILSSHHAGLTSSPCLISSTALEQLEYVLYSSDRLGDAGCMPTAPSETPNAIPITRTWSKSIVQ